MVGLRNNGRITKTINRHFWDNFGLYRKRIYNNFKRTEDCYEQINELRNKFHFFLFILVCIHILTFVVLFYTQFYNRVLSSDVRTQQCVWDRETVKNSIDFIEV